MSEAERHDETSGERTSRWPTPAAMAVVVMFAAQPFAAFADANRTQIEQPGRILLYTTVAVLVCVAALVVLVRWRGRAASGTIAALIAVAVTSFFGFGLVLDPAPATTSKLVTELVVWLAFTALAMRLVVLLCRADWFMTALVCFGAVMLLIPSVSYLSYQASGPSEPDAVAGPAPDWLPEVATPEDPPNVYWFLFDGYARQDQMQLQFGYDNQPFLDELDDRGFEVSATSRGSYPRTHLSVSSTVSMDYITLPDNEIEHEFDELGPIVLGDNPTVDRFRSMGYQYVYSYAGSLEWSLCRHDLTDVCLPVRTPRFAVGELEQVLLDRTPAGLLSNATSFTDPVFVTDEVASRRATGEITEPFFLFSHILTPHWPYRYDTNCEPRATPRDYRSLSETEQQAEYEVQIRCLNELILDAVDRIVAEDPDAIVILQADHGTSFTEWEWDIPFDDWTSRTLGERYSVFNAMRRPDDCVEPPLEGEPLVNTFRIVFACIEDQPIELLPHRAFVAPIEDVQALEEWDLDRFPPP